MVTEIDGKIKNTNGQGSVFFNKDKAKPLENNFNWAIMNGLKNLQTFLQKVQKYAAANIGYKFYMWELR